MTTLPLSQHQAGHKPTMVLIKVESPGANVSSGFFVSSHPLDQRSTTLTGGRLITNDDMTHGNTRFSGNVNDLSYRLGPAPGEGSRSQ